MQQGHIMGNAAHAIGIPAHRRKPVDYTQRDFRVFDGHAAFSDGTLSSKRIPT
jgi:hypothetical protein